MRKPPSLVAGPYSWSLSICAHDTLEHILNKKPCKAQLARAERALVLLRASGLPCPEPLYICLGLSPESLYILMPLVSHDELNHNVDGMYLSK